MLQFQLEFSLYIFYMYDFFWFFQEKTVELQGELYFTYTILIYILVIFYLLQKKTIIFWTWSVGLGSFIN